MLTNITAASAVILSIIIAILSIFIKDRSPTFICLKSYFIVMALLEGLASYLAKLKMNNHILYLYYVIFEIIIITMFLYYFIKIELKKNSYIKYLLGTSLICFLILIANVVFLERIDIAMTTTSIPILLYCFLLFYLLMDVEVDNRLYKMFIISTFLIHGVSILIFSLKEVVFTFDHEKQANIFLIRSLVILWAKILILIPIIQMIYRQKYNGLNVVFDE